MSSISAHRRRAARRRDDRHARPGRGRSPAQKSYRARAPSFRRRRPCALNLVAAVARKLKPEPFSDNARSQSAHLRITDVRQSARFRNQSLSVAAQGQPRPLAPLGARSARGSEAAEQTDPRLRRLRRVPLVPRDGARELRGCRDRGGDERPLCLHQGRSRRASRHRRLAAENSVKCSAVPAAGRSRCFSTPKGEPFWGGTYFPKDESFGRVSFKTVLRQLAQAYQENPDQMEPNIRQIAQRIDEAWYQNRAGTFDMSKLERIAVATAQNCDIFYGGVTGAPKFPNVPVIELVWRAYLRTGHAAIPFARVVHARLHGPRRNLRSSRRRFLALHDR